MTPEELQQIQAIIQTTVTAAVAPINTRLETIEQGQKNLENGQNSLRREVQASEQKILAKFDNLEKLAADYLDGQVQGVKRRLDRVEQHLHLTP